MRKQDKVIFFLLVLLIFLEGLWFAKILMYANSILEAYIFHSSMTWVSSIFQFFAQKLPVIAENTTYFVLAIFHISISLLALKLCFKWSLKHFFYIWVLIYLIFICVSIVLMLAYTTQVSFFKVWSDFVNLFFSPFLMIFVFLVAKLVRK